MQPPLGDSQSVSVLQLPVRGPNVRGSTSGEEEEVEVEVVLGAARVEAVRERRARGRRVVKESILSGRLEGSVRKEGEAEEGRTGRRAEADEGRARKKEEKEEREKEEQATVGRRTELDSLSAFLCGPVAKGLGQ